MTTLSRPVTLGPDEVVDGHAFTHPDHVEIDRAVLVMLTRDFHQHLADTGPIHEPVIRYLPGPDDWYRRVVIPHPAVVGRCDPVFVVGFFGRVRESVDTVVQARIKDLSDRLVDTVIEMPEIIGYSSHLLADERNYANLVLMTDPTAIERWRATDPHPEAADVVSPRYYRHVRIYRGSVAGATLADGDVRLSAVRYWDYREEPTWHAVRRLG